MLTIYGCIHCGVQVLRLSRDLLHGWLCAQRYCHDRHGWFFPDPLSAEQQLHPYRHELRSGRLADDGLFYYRREGAAGDSLVHGDRRQQQLDFTLICP